MISQMIPLVNWSYGVILIASFAVVCLGLVLVVLNLMKNDKKKQE
ncbi:hypothetical protein SAMN04488007_0200 [Maribacter aquivivus]|uniref:Uncharacterized protein n=1 Tax=Maribacter aquivivus TaxID=228958 RepID=A0A1M6IYW9_9FLAO|nr:hypothetical protein [Maribacter aquivivus]SHJ39664.1 hypothetical protein SAMN04488007_0200 [Maribacter aquivivus]